MIQRKAPNRAPMIPTSPPKIGMALRQSARVDHSGHHIPGDDVCDNGAYRCTAQPDGPMSDGVAGEVRTTLHQPQENVFCG